MTARLPTSVPLWRLSTALLILFALLMVLAGRLLYINTALQPRLKAIAARQQRGDSTIPARRGDILDRRGRIVATTRFLPDVFVDPALIADLDDVAAQLAVAINVPAIDILENIRSRPGSRYVVVARDLEEVDAEQVRALKLKGVGLSRHAVREYPLSRSICHVVGFVGRDGEGLAGIEYEFNKHLAGVDGRRATLRDARRRALWRVEHRAKPPIDGGSIVLTIDAELQRIVEEQLQYAVASAKAEDGVAVVMSPRTGEVLALASWPEFDPNHPGEASPDHRRNRAVVDPIEPGSTFKPFLVSGMLTRGVVARDELFDCEDGVRHIGRRRIEDSHPHDKLTLAGIVAQSSNVGMTLLTERAGDPLLYETMLAFGFGQRTGIELPGEHPGIVKPMNEWTSYSNASLAMGYEVLVTPLQLATAFCATVNGGIRVTPTTVRELTDSSGEPLKKDSDAPSGSRVMPEEVADYMRREVLAGVIENGTGKPARLNSYRVCGKTGTAKLTYKDRSGYQPFAYQGSFIAAAPVEEPELVVLLQLRMRDKKTGYYGSAVAAPPVREILARSLAYLGVEPDGPVIAGSPRRQ